MTGAIHKSLGRFSETAIEGETVIMHLDSGAFFSLSGTAHEIWLLIDGQRTAADITAELTARFGCDGQNIADDLGNFIAELTEAGLVRSA